MTFDRIAAAIATALPVELTEDVRKNVHAALSSALAKMDLVTREEMEGQQKKHENRVKKQHSPWTGE